MARKKQPAKAKEPIRIRYKELANGNKSIYLDIYKDGTRAYEFLKLYIIPETDAAAKIQNQNALQAANAIKSQRIIDLANEKAGIKKPSMYGKMLLIDWMAQFKQIKAGESQSKNYPNLIQNAINMLSMYNEKATLKDVDEAFCRGFISFLKCYKQRIRVKKGEDVFREKPFSAKTIWNYYNVLSIALNKAAHDGIITANPFANIDRADRPKVKESTREYLTIEELKSLIATPCSRQDISTAFLFSCFTGLRMSDIETLQWGDIETQNGQTRVCKKMVKTQDNIYLPLSAEAIKWLPERNGASDEAFIYSLPCKYTISYNLTKWAKDSGIKKNVTFHVARHTFATTMLTLGADLYTTSKLLGHKNIATTQIYAKIVDEKKNEAVNLVNGIF